MNRFRTTDAPYLRKLMRELISLADERDIYTSAENDLIDKCKKACHYKPSKYPPRANVEKMP